MSNRKCIKCWEEINKSRFRFYHEECVELPKEYTQPKGIKHLFRKVRYSLGFYPEKEFIRGVN